MKKEHGVLWWWLQVLLLLLLWSERMSMSEHDEEAESVATLFYESVILKQKGARIIMERMPEFST